MKKCREFINKYLNQRVRNIISIFIIIFGITFMYIYSFKSPTYINKLIATNIYKEPANNAFTDQNFYNCVIDGYNRSNSPKKSYTDNLSDEDLKKITMLDCDNYYNTKDEDKIASTNGIEKLTELTKLYAYNNQLTTLDLSKNNKLVKLNNQIIGSIIKHYLYVGDSIEFFVKFADNIKYEFKERTYKTDIIKQDGYKVTGIKAGKTEVTATYNLHNDTENTYNDSYIKIGINVVELISDKYIIDSEKGYIFTFGDIDEDTIKSNLKISDKSVEMVFGNNNLKLMSGNMVVKEFKIINVSNDKIDFNKEFIEIDSTDNLVCNNCKASLEDNKLIIRDLDGNEVYSNKVLSVLSDKYKIDGGKILVLNDYDKNDQLINGIKSNYGAVKVSDGKVQVVYNDKVVREYELVGMISKKYDLDSSLIIGLDGDITKDIECYGCVIESSNDKVLVKYNNEVVKEYTLLTIDSEYKIIRDTILIGNDDEETVKSKIKVSYGKIGIEGDKLYILDGDTVLKEYVLSDSNEYIDIKDMEVNDKKFIVNRINRNTLVDGFKLMIDTNVNDYSILDRNDGEVVEGIIKTGYKLRVGFSVAPVNYTLVVRGDVLGSGNPGVDDDKKIAKHIINGNVFKEDYELLAADYDGDGEIKMIDIVKMLKEGQ